MEILEVPASVQQEKGVEQLRGLIDAIHGGGAYDSLPLRLGTSQWDVLADYLTPCSIRTGQVPIQRGVRDRTLYLVESGTLTVHLQEGATGRMRLAVLAAVTVHEPGGDRLVAELGPDEVVGEMSLLTGEPRSATVVATRDSRLWSMTHSRFQALAAQHSPIAVELAMACAAVVVRRLAHTTMRVAVT